MRGMKESSGAVYPSPMPPRSRHSIGSRNQPSTFEKNGLFLTCCPRILFTGKTKPMDCPATVDVTDCLKFPYRTEEWPGQAHECPAGSSTHGMTQQHNCTCNPGFFKTPGEHLAAPCRVCGENKYCSNGFEETPCGDHEHSPAGSATRAQCTCVEGYEHVNGCLLYTSPSPRDVEESRMPSSA